MKTTSDDGAGLAPMDCSIFDLEACPKCGGTTGFTYKLTVRGEQFQPWKGGDTDSYFEDKNSMHGAYRCEDCGKIIKSNTDSTTPIRLSTPAIDSKSTKE